MTIEELKKKHKQLYSRIPIVGGGSDESKKGFVQEVMNFVDEILRKIPEIEYEEDYSWANDIITRWELYLKSACQKIPYYPIIKPRKSLRKKEANFGRLPKSQNKGAQETYISQISILVRDIAYRYPYLNTETMESVVGAGLVVCNDKFLIVLMKKGPLLGFWGIPSAYVDLRKEDATMVARSKIVEKIPREIRKKAENLFTFRKMWSERVFYPIESQVFPTEIRVCKFEIDDSSIIRPSEAVRWCSPEDTANLPGDIHPLVSDIIRREFNKPAIARKLADRAWQGVRQLSEERIKAKSTIEELLQRKHPVLLKEVSSILVKAQREAAAEIMTDHSAIIKEAEKIIKRR